MSSVKKAWSLFFLSVTTIRLGKEQKLKQSLYRPWRFQKVEAPKISRQSVYEGG